MDINYQGHSKRTQEAMGFWVKVATDYNAGMTAEKIASRYTNPRTGKNYTRQHVYLILRKIKNTPIN
jgi:hypothetical protein